MLVVISVSTVRLLRTRSCAFIDGSMAKSSIAPERQDHTAWDVLRADVALLSSGVACHSHGAVGRTLVDKPCIG
eukprot:1326260-Amphidinium_carterae.1